MFERWRGAVPVLIPALQAATCQGFSRIGVNRGRATRSRGGELGEASNSVAGPGEAVADVHAASINATDYKVRLGSGGAGNLKSRHMLRRDFSGVASALGPGVTHFKIGDLVFGVTDQGSKAVMPRCSRSRQSTRTPD